MLMESPGQVTVKIDGIAASAASVVAMAGSTVLMSPVSMLMCHNPMTLAFGDTVEMERAIAMLSEVKESIINAYQLKTGLTRAKISHLMDAETWFNAKKAVELGFADGILFTSDSSAPESEGLLFSRMSVTNSLLSKLPRHPPGPNPQAQADASTHTIESLEKRLYLIQP
jgi:ATP-dependent Clp protease protease subunit